MCNTYVFTDIVIYTLITKQFQNIYNICVFVELVIYAYMVILMINQKKRHCHLKPLEWDITCKKPIDQVF